MLKSLIVFLAAVLLAFTPALADEAKVARMISISGHGEVRTEPDIAFVSIGVVSPAATAQEALANNITAMNNLMTVLGQSGITGLDIATSNFSVSPRYDYGQTGGQQPKLIGYEVINTVNVTIRKIDTLGQLLDKAVNAGSNQINNISLAVSNTDAFLDQARKAAFADARRKADIYAAAGSFALGNIISVAEGGGFQPPIPLQAKAMHSEASAHVPIFRGEQTLSIDVSIVWEIR